MKFNQVLNQRQADTGAFVCSSLRALNPVESLKEVGNLVLRNANAGIEMETRTSWPESWSSTRMVP